MHIKSIASAALLTAAFGFGSFAYAQDAAATALPTMIGNQEVSAADAERVKVYCEDLQTAANQAEGTDAGATENADPAATTEGTTSDTATAAVGSIDLDAITVETCLEGGWIEAAAM